MPAYHMLAVLRVCVACWPHQTSSTVAVLPWQALINAVEEKAVACKWGVSMVAAADAAGAKLSWPSHTSKLPRGAPLT